MSITSTEKKDHNIVELEIAVSAEKLKEATDRVYRKKAKGITVPGFRKGKAPRQIIEKMYGEGVFLEDAVNELYPGAYSEAVDEAGLDPVDKADVEILELSKEEGFKFRAKVTVKPEVQIGEYKGLEATKTIYSVEDSSVESEIERMRERGARIITVEGRAAKEGDTAVIDFEGFVDDVPFDGGKAENHSIELGSHSFIDTFEDQIVGHNPGDEFDVNVTFPENYHAEELKGKPAVFKVKLHELKEKELPALDDEFAKDVSEFDTLQELRDDLKANMQKAQDTRATDELENALLDQIVQTVEGEIPEVMYENKVDDLVRDFEYRLSSQGMNMELYLQYTGMELESFRKSFREQAERQVKVRLALEAIARKEELKASDEEIDKEFERMAEQYKMELEQVKSILSLKDMSADLACTKALDLVRDNAKITEKPYEPEAADEEKKEESGEKKKAPAKKPAAKKTAAKKSDETEAKKAPAKKPAAKKPAAKKEDKADAE